MRDEPALRGRPLAVGGGPKAGGDRHLQLRSACLWRAFGDVHREGLEAVPATGSAATDFERYRAASRQILDIYRDYTALVEPLSLDEAYLDVTGIERCRGSATLMAAEIRARIHAEVGITASAGIAPNKFIAKVASDWNKPDGQFVVRPEQVDAFVAALPVGKLFGVGRVTAARMRRLESRPVPTSEAGRWPSSPIVSGASGRGCIDCAGESTSVRWRPIGPENPCRSKRPT